MKVLHVVNAYTAGGMENGIANLTHGLYERGITADVCVLTRADGFAGRLHPSANVYEFDRKKGLDPSIWLKVAKLISMNNYDVIHTHNWTGMIYGVPPSLWSGIPVIHGEHSELFDWEQHPLRLLLRRLFYHWCATVHVLSRAQLQQLQSYRILEGVDALAISNGTDTIKFSPQDQVQARSKLGLPKDSFIVGIVGRLVETKRHGFLLDSFLEAGQRLANLHLVIAGSGGNIEKKVFEECENHPLSKRIHWLGARDEMPSIYNALDLLVIPSVNEGMTNVALEAMACGVSVVANQVCGISQIIDHENDGMVIPMNSPSNLADVIIEMANNRKALKKRGEQARIKIVERFSLSHMLDQYASAYAMLSNHMLTL
jgi:glycosyltransferase involved in cell wall biosynthesis